LDQQPINLYQDKPKLNKTQKRKQESNEDTFSKFNAIASTQKNLYLVKESKRERRLWILRSFKASKGGRRWRKNQDLQKKNNGGITKQVKSEGVGGVNDWDRNWD
jgi:hypothetical protein